MHKNSIITLILIIFSFSLFGQMTISTGVLTPDQYVNNLVGPGVIVSNVTYTGTTQQIGSFGGTSDIGFGNGVVISSGATTELVGGPGTTSAGTVSVSGISNTDLLSVANVAAAAVGIGTISSTTDAAILEFDFVPVSNLVSFNFVFASEEYLTYVNTSFNDVFGFFVAGPGITGPYSSPAGFPDGSMNLALVPGTSIPITISTIHPGLNSEYYIDNTGSTHAMNGFTTPIPVTFAVICGETYHFKFAVADCADNYLSTAVFLEDDSFTSPPVNVSLQTANGSDTIPEACVGADFLFIRSACTSIDELIVNYSVSGTATDDVDFVLQDSPVILAPGQDTAYINILPIIDALAEGVESIIITVTYLDAAGDPQVIEGTVYIADIQPLVVNAPDIYLKCYQDSIELIVTASGASGAYSYEWEASGATTNNDYVSIDVNGSYDFIVTVTDSCLGSVIDTVTVIMDQTLEIDTMYMTPASCEPDGWVSVGIIGDSITPAQGLSYFWEDSFGNPGPAANQWSGISSGWYFITVEDAVCSTNDSVFVNMLNPPIAQFTASAVAGCDPLTVTFTNTSQNTTDYAWDFGNGNILNVSSTAPQTQVYTSSTIVTLIASEGNCSDETSISITISICGCMDPLATNYNSAANFDDGTCVYPLPTVEAPNVFTPGGDDVNELFYLKTTNSTSIELTILNRWGNTLYESVGINPAWNGKNKTGIEIEEGVYFYKYRVNGLNGQYLEGHGFFHLVR